MTEPDPTVGLIAEALTPWPAPPTPQAWIQARKVADALAAAGRLLPPGGETRTEWGTRLKAHGEYDEEMCPSFAGAGMTAEERARSRAELWRGRFGAELVDVMRREIYTGPWQPDTEESADG